MNQQEFDKRIADKLAQQTFAPKEQGWLALQSQMAAAVPETIIDETPKAATPFSWLKVAAVIIPLIAIWGVYQFASSHKTTQGSTNVATTNTATNATNNTIGTTTTTANSIINNETTITNNTPQITNATNNTNTSYKTSNTITKPININTNITEQPIASTPIINPTTASNNQTTNTIKPIHTQSNNVIVDNNELPIGNIIQTTTIAKQEPANTNKQYIPLDITTPNPAKPIDKRMGLSVVAGFQTNTQTSFSNAINIGIATQKNISRKLYVDASVSISSNNPSWLQSRIVSPTELSNSIASLSNGNSITTKNGNASDENAYGVNQANNTFSANGNTIPISELTDDQNIAAAAAYRLASNQVEFAPMLGYKISKRFKVAGGVDATKIITTSGYNKSVDLLLLQSQVVPTVRTWDVGAIAKLEYAITKKIIVGYRHRQGLTSITSGTANRRSYNGAVVKYQF